MCRKCNKYIHIDEVVKNRTDLADILGDYFNIKCKNCSKSNFLHVNEVKAYESYFSLLAPIVTGLAIAVGSTLIFSKKGILTNVGLIIGGLIILSGFASKANSNPTAFNKYKIPMKPRD